MIPNLLIYNFQFLRYRILKFLILHKSFQIFFHSDLDGAIGKASAGAAVWTRGYGSSKLGGAAAKHIQMTVSTISCYYIYVCVNSQAINKHVCMWNINVKKIIFFLINKSCRF